MADIGQDPADSFAILIDDTSPTIVYTPFGDTYSAPNLSAGWNPYFSESGFATNTAVGQEGQGTSFHVTSADGASMGLRWNGECPPYSPSSPIATPIPDTSSSGSSSSGSSSSAAMHALSVPHELWASMATAIAGIAVGAWTIL